MKTLRSTLCITLAFLGPMPATSFAPSIHSNTHRQQRNHHRTGTSRNTSNLIITSAATIDNSHSSYEMSDFARRMKNIIRKDTNEQLRSKRSANSHQKAPKNLMRIETLSEFKRVVGDEKEKLVVVRWYAPWCKACKAIAPSFYRLASQYPNVIFVDVPVTPENANLHQGLGVPSLPYGHIYHPAGKLVEELKISKKHFGDFALILQSYVNEECGVDFDEGSGIMMDPKYGLPDGDNSNRRDDM